MSHERERRGLIAPQRSESPTSVLDQLQCAYPRAQWQGTHVTADGMAPCTHRFLAYGKLRGLLLMCLLWIRIMTRLIVHEFTSVLEESTDGTKPITYITYRGKQLYDHQRYIF